MRIAFLNPWKHAAENQAFCSLQKAAARVGHEFIHCSNSAEIDACAPDFVLASASTQPKLNDFPHYGVIHEPRDRFLTNRRYFQNLLSYDGYLTIADSLERFLRDVSNGIGRSEEIGFYYNTSQRHKHAADLDALIRDRKLLITFFGTNWDRRRHSFFRLLSQVDGVQICGPPHSWPDINRKAYGGALEFDGESVQARYAANGIGLCLLSDLHLRDDVVSNRIFEITSAGAIAICCDVPWIRKHFGNSVYYVDQGLSDRLLVSAVLRCRDEIYADPAEAMARAKRAREVFERNFAAEVLIEKAIAYHDRITSARRAERSKAKASYEPFVSVIVRCGSRPVGLVGRALHSLSQQTYGQFEVVFVRHQELDLTPLLSTPCPNIRSMEVVDCFNCGRSTALWKGLTAVTGEYFSVLDDDDWLFSNHFELLFRPFPSSPQSCFFAYSGSIAQHSEPKLIEGGGLDRRELFRFGIEHSQELADVSGSFASNCFVASRDLLHPALLSDPHMATAEDSYLILSLLAQAPPRFSYAATSIHERGRSDESDFARHPRRFEDELTLRTRLFGRHRPPFASPDGWSTLSSFWEQRPDHRTEIIEKASDRIIYRIRECPFSMLPESARACVSKGYRLRRSSFSPGSRAEDASVGSALIRCPEAAWAYGTEILLRLPRSPELECLLVAEVVVERGEVGVGLLNASETDFLFRRPLRTTSRIHEVHIPISDCRKIGRFVIQNWQNPGPAIASVLSLRIFR